MRTSGFSCRRAAIEFAAFIIVMLGLSVLVTLATADPESVHAEAAPPETVISIQPVAAESSQRPVFARQTGEAAAPTPTEEPTPQPTPTPTTRSYQGITEGDVIFGELTFYDICVRCCGKTDGMTASGLVIANGKYDPFVVSCNWLPLGSIVEVDGIRYAVMDRGGSSLDRIGRLDVFTPEGHQAALERGRVKGIEIIIIEIGEI